jgi:hypothetical protein
VDDVLPGDPQVLGIGDQLAGRMRGDDVEPVAVRDADGAREGAVDAVGDGATLCGGPAVGAGVATSLRAGRRAAPRPARQVLGHLRQDPRSPTHRPATIRTDRYGRSMHAMQYEITLPAAYDMSAIRHRVATRGGGTDAFPGLGLKAYAIRERGVQGSPVNQYAPFYLWADPAGMNAFLFGAPFAGLSADFGRPAVRHWTGVAFTTGPAGGEQPCGADRSVTALAADVPLAEAVGAAVRRLEAERDRPDLHSAAVVVDPATWELAHFRLWAGDAPEGPGERYQVLHASTPHLGDLPGARSRTQA